MNQNCESIDKKEKTFHIFVFSCLIPYMLHASLKNKNFDLHMIAVKESLNIFYQKDKNNYYDLVSRYLNTVMKMNDLILKIIRNYLPLGVKI
jgi:hypothetical protein